MSDIVDGKWYASKTALREEMRVKRYNWLTEEWEDKEVTASERLPPSFSELFGRWIRVTRRLLAESVKPRSHRRRSTLGM